MPTTPTPATPDTDPGPVLQDTSAPDEFKPFNQDSLRGMFGGLDKLPPPLASHLNEQFASSPQPEDDKKAYVNTLFLQDRFHKSFDEIADNKDFYRNQFAHQTYGQAEVDENGLYTMAGKVLGQEHDEKNLIGGMYADMLNKSTADVPDGKAGVAVWIAANRRSPGFNIQHLDLYTHAATQIQDDIAQFGGAHRAAIEPIKAMLTAARNAETQDVNDPTWEKGIQALQSVDPADREKVLWLASHEMPKAGEKPMKEKIVRSVMQGADEMAQDLRGFASEMIDPLFMHDASEMSDPNSAYGKGRDRHQVEKMVTDIIAGKVDPQESSNVWGKVAIGAAKNLPTIMATMTPAAIPLLGASIQQQQVDKFKSRGMSDNEAENLGTLTAIPETAYMWLTGKMIAGRVPGLKGMLAGLKSTSARFAATGATEALGLAFSTSAQQVTPDIVQQLASYGTKAVPGMGWKKIGEDYLNVAPDILLQMVPYWLVGTGMGHFRDEGYAKEMLSKPDHLTAAGFPAETVTKAQAAPTVAAKENILQADMPKREFGAAQTAALTTLSRHAPEGAVPHRAIVGESNDPTLTAMGIPQWKTLTILTEDGQVIHSSVDQAEKAGYTVTKKEDGTFSVKTPSGEELPGRPQTPTNTRALLHDDGTMTVQKTDTGQILAQTNTPEMAAKVIQDHETLRETSLKNAAAEMERKGYGMEEATQPEKRVMAESWNRAGDTLAKDPEAGARLAKELKENPNLGISDDQSALLLRHKVGLENALNEVQGIINEPDASPERKSEATRQAADLSQQLLDFMDAVHRRGSEWGREGRWRQAMAKEDYSFAAQETLLRTAKGGAALTPEETTKLTNKLAAIKAKNAELEAKVKELSAKRSPTSAADAAVNRLARTSLKPSRWRGAEAVRSKLHARAQESLKALIEGGSFGKARMGVSPKEIGHMLNIGADAIYSAGLDFAKWSTEMISRIGEAVKPHLASLWPDAQKMFHDEQRAGIVDTLKAQTGLNDEPNISRGAQELAKGFIAQGVKGRDAIVDAVHDELKKAVPGITRREAMDAISGYGNYKPLTHDEAATQLSDIKGQLQQIAKLEDLQAGERIKKTGAERREPSEEENRLKGEVAAMLKFEQVTPRTHQGEPAELQTEEKAQERRMNQAKARLNAKRLELEDKIRRGDFEPAVKPEPVALDAEGLRIKSEVERLKQDLAIGRAKVQEAARPRYQKALSQIAGLARASALSGYHTLGKLAGFSFSRLVEAPFTEGLGAIIRRVPGFRDVAGKANLEAGKEAQGLGKFYAKFSTDGMREALQTIRTGKGQLKAELGNAMHNALPLHWYDFPGLLHATEKSPLLVADFNLRLEKATAHAIANGLDVTDPMVQGALRKEAYDYAQRAILQERNIVSDAINGFMDRLEKADPTTKKVDANKAALAAFIRTFITKGIIKTPLNHIAQTLEASPLGLVKGISDLGRAHMQGIDKLTPHEANTIIRLFKVAGVGTAVFVWGAVDATKDAKDRMFGGFWQPGDKRDDKDAKYGRVRIDGHELIIPAPIMMVAQMGSTFMRVANSKLHKKDKEDKGMIAGAAASVLALAQSAPIANPITNVAQTLERGQADTVLWDELASLVPQLVQNIAVDLDGKSRAPKTLGQTIEATIPGLRENVPETKSQLKKDRNAFTLRQP
jgi:hypothetical protein